MGADLDALDAVEAVGNEGVGRRLISALYELD